MIPDDFQMILDDHRWLAGMMSGADPGTQMNPDEPKLLAAKLKKCKKDNIKHDASRNNKKLWQKKVVTD